VEASGPNWDKEIAEHLLLSSTSKVRLNHAINIASFEVVVVYSDF